MEKRYKPSREFHRTEISLVDLFEAFTNDEIALWWFHGLLRPNRRIAPCLYKIRVLDTVHKIRLTDVGLVGKRHYQDGKGGLR